MPRQIHAFNAPTPAIRVNNPLEGDSKHRSRSQRLITSSRRFLSNVLKRHRAVQALDLSPLTFQLVWFNVVGAHLLCALFLAGCAATYSYLTNPIMADVRPCECPPRGPSAGTGIPISSWRTTHLQSREWKETGNPREDFAAGPLPATIQHLLGDANATVKFIRGFKHATASVMNAWSVLFSRTGLFGVEGRHFLTVFQVREAIELSTQTYQALQSSKLLPRVWLNDILVATLITNCWSTLAVHHLISHQSALARVVALVVDVFLCLVLVVAIPVVIFTPYATAFDISNHRFGPSVSLYDPTFMARFVLEAKLIFASSLADFGAKWIPHFAIYLSLVSISGLVAQSPKENTSTTMKTPKSVKVSSIVDNLGCKSNDHVQEVRSVQRSKIRFTPQNVLKTVFCAWGAVILALHLHARAMSQFNAVHGCRAATRSWLKTQRSCSSLVVNCDRYGKQSAVDSIFKRIDTSALATLTFAHCPRLVMPSALIELQSLMILHVFNSSVASWGNFDTTFSNARLTTLVVAKSNVSSVAAQGLLLPVSLSTVQFCETNLTNMPAVLSWSVHPMTVVAFDYSKLTSLPTSLVTLQAFAISLKGNQLERIPELAAMPPGQMFYGLELNDNPLRELPETLGSASNFFIGLDLQRTNVTKLPPWTMAQVVGAICMHGTPYCDETITGIRRRILLPARLPTLRYT